jgi:hypothetical protein
MFAFWPTAHLIEPLPLAGTIPTSDQFGRQKPGANTSWQLGGEGSAQDVGS